MKKTSEFPLGPVLPPPPEERRYGARRLAAGVLLGLTGLSVTGAVVSSTCTLCYAVTTTGGGAPVAYVQGQESYQQAVERVEAQVSEILQEEYCYQEVPALVPTIAPRQEVQAGADLTDALMDTVEQVKPACLPLVDGVTAGACADQAEVEAALEAVKDRYRGEGTLSTYFDSEVDLVQDYLPLEAELLSGVRITDEDSLFEFVKTVQEKEEGMIGVSLWNFFRLDSPWYSAKHDHVYTQDNVNVLGDQTWVWVGLSDDNKTVLNAVVPGDSAEEFAKMPAGYQDDFITEYIVDRTKWNPYLNPNRGGTDTVEKPAAISYSTLSEYESKVKGALEVNPDEEYGFYVIEDAQRNMEEGAVICDMATNNWLVVPEWSEKTDAVMYFLDWMFGSQEAHDLFELGIQGEDWEAVGEDGYKKLDVDESIAYSMPTYSFTQNPTYIRVSEFVSGNEEIKSRFDYMYDTSTYELSPLAGFVFDATNVETQIANVSALSNELQLTISLYDADEAVEKINQWHKDAMEVGLEEIRAELISQIQAFLDAKNAN